MEDQERKAEPFDSPGTKNSNKKNVRFKRSKIFVTPSNDSEEDSDPPVNSISRLASYANRRSPRNHTSVQARSSQMFVPMSPTQATISSASCSPSSISDSHHLTESSPLMETPEAIRNWNLQKNRRTADTTYLSSSGSPASLVNSNQGGYNYYYSDLRAEMNARTPGKSNWKSMLMHNGDDDDYDHHRTRFERFIGDGRRMKCYAFIALLGSLLFTLIWLVTIEPCSTSDSIHSSIKYVFGKTGSHSNNQQIQSLAHWEDANMVNWEGADFMSPVRRLFAGQEQRSRFGRGRGSSSRQRKSRRRTIEKSGKIFRNADKDDGEDRNDNNDDEEEEEEEEKEEEEEDEEDEGDSSNNDDNTYSTSSALSSTFRLVLLGDSLMSESYKKSNLGGVIEDMLSSETVSVINCAKSGSEIRIIRERPLLNCTLPHNPDATILFFDTVYTFFALYSHSCTLHFTLSRCTAILLFSLSPTLYFTYFHSLVFTFIRT